MSPKWVSFIIFEILIFFILFTFASFYFISFFLKFLIVVIKEDCMLKWDSRLLEWLTFFHLRYIIIINNFIITLIIINNNSMAQNSKCYMMMPQQCHMRKYKNYFWRNSIKVLLTSFSILILFQLLLLA